MKRLGLCAALALVMASAAHAQIPVSVTTDATAITNQIQTMGQWAQQIAQMKSQLTQLQQQYSALTGSRNLGQIFDDPSLRNYLPSNWQSVYDQVKNGGYSGLSGNAASIFNSNKIFDACSAIQSATAQNVCQARAVKGAQDQSTALSAYNTANSRINQLDQLRTQINATQDPKAIAELNGRIATEEAAIQNEQIKLNLYKMVADAQDKVNEERATEAEAQTWAAKGTTSIQPLSFSGQ